MNRVYTFEVIIFILSLLSLLYQYANGNFSQKLYLPTFKYSTDKCVDHTMYDNQYILQVDIIIPQ